MKKLGNQPLARGAFARWIVLAGILGFGGANAGEISVYTAYEEDEIKVYLEGFQKVAPDIKVNLLRLSTGDLSARIVAEAWSVKHDVIWGMAVTHMVDPRIQSLIEPYAPSGISNINRKFYSPDHAWFAATGYMAVFCVNTERLKQKNLPLPTSWQDLTKPVYKGEVVMPNPVSSGTGYMQIAGVLQGQGEAKGWQLLRDLNKNIAEYTKSGSKPCKDAMAGAHAIGVSFEYPAIKAIKDGNPIKMVIPSEGAGYELEANALKRMQNGLRFRAYPCRNT